MRALAIDTSTYRASVALSDEGTCVAREEHVDPARHAETLFDRIDRALASAGWSKSALDLIVAGIGPGSFTGVRVALASAKGIALGLDRPIVGVSGLEAMAAAALPTLSPDVDAVAALLDAKKGEAFWAAYDRARNRLAGPGHVPVGEVVHMLAGIPAGKLVLLGEFAVDAPAGCTALRSSSTDLPDAAHLARVGLELFARRGSDDVAALEPVYVRPPDITLPKTK